jgi:hypothetical protein
MTSVIPVAMALLIATLMATLSAPLAAQEKKVPKDSMRGSIPGCTKGYVFTAGPRTVDEVGRLAVPEGMHLRMNGPKKLMAEIKAHEGEMIQITGLMKKEQYNPTGVSLGGGVRVSPGSAPGPSTLSAAPVPSIDVESFQPIPGNCP